MVTSRSNACFAYTRAEMWSRTSKGKNANNATTSNISQNHSPCSSTVVTTRGIMRHHGRSTRGCQSTKRNNISMGASRRPTRCITTLIWTRTCMSSSFVSRLSMSSLVTFSSVMTNSSRTLTPMMANRTRPMLSARSSSKSRMRKKCDEAVLQGGRCAHLHGDHQGRLVL